MAKRNPMTNWTLADALSLVKAWKPPKGCRVLIDPWEGEILLTLQRRRRGCFLSVPYSMRRPLWGIVDKLNMLAVDLEITHGDCAYTAKLNYLLEYNDMMFAMRMRDVRRRILCRAAFRSVPVGDEVVGREGP